MVSKFEHVGAGIFLTIASLLSGFSAYFFVSPDKVVYGIITLGGSFVLYVFGLAPLVTITGDSTIDKDAKKVVSDIDKVDSDIGKSKMADVIAPIIESILQGKLDELNSKLSVSQKENEAKIDELETVVQEYMKQMATKQNTTESLGDIVDYLEKVKKVKQLIEKLGMTDSESKVLADMASNELENKIPTEPADKSTSAISSTPADTSTSAQ